MGGGSSQSRKAGDSGEVGETGAKAVGATAATTRRLVVRRQGWLERVSKGRQHEKCL